jgi:hypothetical protein
MADGCKLQWAATPGLGDVGTFMAIWRSRMIQTDWRAVRPIVAAFGQEGRESIQQLFSVAVEHWRRGCCPADALPRW